MALIIANRVKETTTSTGQGALTLAGAMVAYQTFAAVCAVGDTAYYALQAVDATGAPTGAWELGIGTYSAASTLTRTTVLSSSNANAAVVLAAGTTQVWIDLEASWFATHFGNFAGAVNIVGPNATTPVVSYTAANAAANADIALAPKGTGALLAAVPDGTATAGNKRGGNAVDWQTARIDATQVASGLYSLICGGYQNKAVGTYSLVVGGRLNASAAGNYNFLGGGNSNTSNADYGVICGGYSSGIVAGALNGFIGGGGYHSINAGGSYATICGGSSNGAGGGYAAICGGFSNAANGTYAFIGAGASNTAGRQYATIAGGQSNDLSSGADWSSCGGGYQNTIQGTYAVIGGGSGNYALASYATTGGGLTNNANAPYSTIPGGAHANTRGIIGMLAYSSGRIGSLGDCQWGKYILKQQTADATATVLTTDKAVPASNNAVILPGNASYDFSGRVVARSSSGDTKTFKFEGAIKRGASAATAALIAPVTVTTVTADTGASSWTVAVTADTINGGLAVTVTGAAAVSIRWVANIDTTEVIL